jgi:hypothetical protein
VPGAWQRAKPPAIFEYTFQGSQSLRIVIP